MAIPADATNVMIDASLPATPVILQLGDGTTRSISGGRRVFSARGTTNASGDVTFNFGTAFAALPVVSVAFQGAASQSPVDYRITALSTTSVTINVRQSLATVIALLGLTLLAASAPLNGATIHVTAVEVGNV